MHWPSEYITSTPGAEVEMSYYPTYVSYFHAITASGIGDHSDHRHGIYVVKLQQVDRRCNDGMDNVNSITLEYVREEAY